MIVDGAAVIKKHQWCSGNINAFQAFALGSIPGWCISFSSFASSQENIIFDIENDLLVIFVLLYARSCLAKI